MGGDVVGHIQAWNPRQSEIEDDQGGSMAAVDDLQRGVAVGSDQNRIALELQLQLVELTQRKIIFDDEKQLTC